MDADLIILALSLFKENIWIFREDSFVFGKSKNILNLNDPKMIYLDIYSLRTKIIEELRSNLLDIDNSIELSNSNEILNSNEINMISFEDLSKKEDNKDVKDKITLITKIGTKLANLIFYIKNCKEKCIIFSQWDDLLKKVGDVLDTYGIKNVFCRGNIWTRDKAIRDFTYKNDIQVIMLSSESAAAGTNLTAATKVILLDPISGSYEYRKNMEGQAIGRAHRTGQTKQVSVVRFIIKDTVEEEIYNENIKDDAKFKSEVKMTMLTDDNINLDTTEIEKITEQAELNEKKKELKPRKKVITKDKKKAVIKDDSDFSDYE